MSKENQNTQPPTDVQTIADLQKSLSALQKSVDGLSRENAALKKELAVSQPAASPELPKLPANNLFEVSGKSYAFVAPAFLYDGKTITATDALTDEALLQDLVTRQSGIIREVA